MSGTSQHIFLASRSDEESRAMRRAVQSLTGEFYPLQFVMTRPHALLSLVDRQSNSVVIKTQDWRKEEIKWVEDLRESGYRGPIIMVVKNRVAANLKEVAEHEPIVFIDGPSSATDLLGILRRFLADKGVQQQVYRRYPTSQVAEVEFFERKLIERRTSSVRNLSKGGAYLEFMTPSPIKIGETVHLKMDLKEMNRSYIMTAKVVWTSKAETGHQGVGLEFIGHSDRIPL